MPTFWKEIIVLEFYLKGNDHVLLVDNADIEVDFELKVDNCRLPDVLHVGGGIYDAIVFPKIPPEGILRKAIEKIYWGGYIIALGVETIVEEAGYQVMYGDPGRLVLRRPPLPDEWTEEYLLLFPKGGDVWDPETKAMHQRYRDGFAVIDAEWVDTVVIEYGCGRGEITRLIGEAGAKRVYAIDNSHAAISMTNRFCNDLPSVLAICDDALLWRSPHQANVIVALDFVEHIGEDELGNMFVQWSDNLRVGGLIHIVTPLGPDAVRGHKWAPSPKKLREKMEAAGFSYKRHVRPEGSRKFSAEFIKEHNSNCGRMG